MSDFYSVKEFAAKLGKHPSSIRRAIKNNLLHAIRVGQSKKASYSIPRTEIERIGLVDLENIINKLVTERIENGQTNQKS